MKVVTPYGEIPWNDHSRINDEEMKRLMKEVVNKLYTVLLNINDAQFMSAFLKRGSSFTTRWDKPEELANYTAALLRLYK